MRRFSLELHFNFKGTKRYFPTQEVSQANKRHQSCGIVGVAVFVGEHPQLQIDIHVTLNAQDWGNVFKFYLRYVSSLLLTSFLALSWNWWPNERHHYLLKVKSTCPVLYLKLFKVACMKSVDRVFFGLSRVLRMPFLKEMMKTTCVAR